MGAPGLDSGVIFSRIWVLSPKRGRGRAVIWRQSGEANSSSSAKPFQTEHRENLQAHRIFSLCQILSLAKAPAKRGPAQCPARQARLLPPQHLPLESRLFVSAGPAWIKNCGGFVSGVLGGWKVGMRQKIAIFLATGLKYVCFSLARLSVCAAFLVLPSADYLG